MEWRCVLDARAIVGEGPVWSPQEQALYWVDILGPALHRFDPATGADRAWPMPAPIGCLGLCRSGDAALVALKTGVHRFSFATGSLTFVVHPEEGVTGNRYNDGKVGPDGRFWFGSMDDTPARAKVAALYCLDPGGACRRMVDGLSCSNGLAWSPDGRIMYLADSRGPWVRAYDYDLITGDIANPRLLAEPDHDVGRPDGGAVDMDGFYWSAGVSAGRVNRFAPDGTLVQSIPVPIPTPTCCCFGGPDMKTLFITSLRQNVAPEVLAATPMTGSLFAAEVDVPGVPVARFAG